MAAVAALLSALARLTWRDLASFRSLQGNNFFAFAVFLTAMQPPSASLFLLLLGGLIFLLSSEDPLRRIPPERLDLWPLSHRQRLVLRIAALALSPVLWLATVLGVASGHWRESAALVTISVLTQSVHIVAARIRQRQPYADLRRFVPRFPGRFGLLVTLNLRQMFVLLDTYIALLLTLAVQLYVHASNHPDPAALSGVAVLTALALSTYTQCLFGLDGTDAAKRYRLFPVRGWQVLLAKDAALLAVLLALVVSTDVLAGLGAGLAALALGHRRSIQQPLPQRRWRFAAGELWPGGVLQIFAVFFAGFGLKNSQDARLLAIPVVCWLGSLWHYGREFERTPSPLASAGE